MAEKAFPDLASKLNAPVRKTAFERQKEEAEAKRKREEAETAAALKEFEESFADDSDLTVPGGPAGYNQHGNRQQMGAGLGFRGQPGGQPPTGPGKRHFGGGGMRSGPGSLPPPPPPPSGFSGRKRGYDGSFAQGQQQTGRGVFAYGDTVVDGRRDVEMGSDSEGDAEEKEKAAPRQMIQLGDLPVGTTQDEILDMLQVHAPTLRVDKVELLPPPAPGSTAKRSLSAVVTMADGVVNREVDSATTALQRLYLGLGHRLSISRHTASNVASATLPQGPQNDSLPFGAKVMEQENHQPKMRYNMAAPPSESGFGSSRQKQDGLPSTVYVKVPSDLRQLKLINKTIEGLIKIGPEFEAALMQRPEVRSEEKWAWLFDSTSVGGVYFRWRLWYLSSGRFSEREEERNEAGAQALEVIFEDQAPWKAPDRRPRFERVTRVDEFLSDPEYDEEEEEYSDNEESKKAPELNLTGEAAEAQYLNPLHRARLTHLLARLPTSPANLRRGDVARVSAFAFRHAGHCAEEVAHMLAANVAQPLSLTDANPENHPNDGVEYIEGGSSEDDGSEYEPPDDVMASVETRNGGLKSTNAPDKGSDVKPEEGSDEKEDTSSAKLIGLYVISDVLHGCDTAGVRNTWKYKGLIEKAFKEQKIFEQLGRLERDMKWGRVKADRWKSRVMNLLDIWAGWSLYSADTMQGFIDAFNNPPLTEEEKAADEKERKERKLRRDAQKSKGLEFRQDDSREQSMDVIGEEPPKKKDSDANGEKTKADPKDDGKRDGVDTPMGDADDVEGQGMFGGNGAASEKAKSEEPKKEDTSKADAAKPAVISKGSKRPSTRTMLE